MQKYIVRGVNILDDHGHISLSTWKRMNSETRKDILTSSDFEFIKDDALVLIPKSMKELPDVPVEYIDKLFNEDDKITYKIWKSITPDKRIEVISAILDGEYDNSILSLIAPSIQMGMLPFDHASIQRRWLLKNPIIHDTPIKITVKGSNYVIFEGGLLVPSNQTFKGYMNVLRQITFLNAEIHILSDNYIYTIHKCTKDELHEMHRYLQLEINQCISIRAFLDTSITSITQLFNVTVPLLAAYPIKEMHECNYTITYVQAFERGHFCDQDYMYITIGDVDNVKYGCGKILEVDHTNEIFDRIVEERLLYICLCDVDQSSLKYKLLDTNIQWLQPEELDALTVNGCIITKIKYRVWEDVTDDVCYNRLCALQRLHTWKTLSSYDRVLYCDNNHLIVPAVNVNNAITSNNIYIISPKTYWVTDTMNNVKGYKRGNTWIAKINGEQISTGDDVSLELFSLILDGAEILILHDRVIIDANGIYKKSIIAETFTF